MMLLLVISTFNTRAVETFCNNRAHDSQTYTVSYASAQYELTGASRGLILVYKSYFLKIIFGDF